MFVCTLADSKTSRREAVRKKTAEYLQYTEQLQIKLFKRNQKAQVKRETHHNKTVCIC